MTTDTSTPHHKIRSPPTHLAARRTIMAADRTLMAWTRTSLSMLSFGFTIYKFLQGMAQPLGQLNSPELVGLFLVGMGTLSMLLGTASYWATLKDLQRTEEFSLRRPSLAIACVMTLAGVALFVSIAASAT